MTSPQPDHETIFNILDEILSSEDFQHHEKYQELLKFLVNSQLNNQVVNEKLLAMEIFDKDATFDPAVDSSVRTYMSNLRKKVEHYNLTEGKNKEIILTLPKGGYHVDFIHRKQSPPLKRFNFRLLPHLIYLPVILVLLVLIILQLSDQRQNNFTDGNRIKQNNPLWHNLFDTDMKTLIVLGDYYFFKMPLDSQHSVYARNVFINSEAELSEYLDEHPRLKTEVSTIYHSYLDEHIPLCVSQLTRSFELHALDIELKLSSEIRLEDLQNYNVIYIGSYKTLYLLETVTANLNFTFELKPNKSVLKIYSQKADDTFTYSFLTNPDTHARNDYAMFVKIAGHNDNTFYFFLSQHDFGNLATVKYFTNPGRLHDFLEGVSSEYVEALFEVTGILRTDFDINLLHVNELHSHFEIKVD